MMQFWRRGVLAVLLAVVVLPGLVHSTDSRAQPQPTLPQSDLIIQTASGPKKFHVELADNDQSRARGLMFRTQMAPDAGMLFDFKQEAPASFWMRNTLLPLDMLFIRADGTIHHIHQRAIPHDETGIDSNGPVLAVLELNGGTVQRLGIKPGDKVEHPIFAKSRR